MLEPKNLHLDICHKISASSNCCFPREFSDLELIDYAGLHLICYLMGAVENFIA